jgi:hypothetical protein
VFCAQELKLDEIHSSFAKGNSWVLTRKNDNEAVIEQQPLDQMAELIAEGVKAVVLKFWRADKTSTSGTNSVGSKMSMRSKKSSKSGVSFSPMVQDVDSGAQSPISEGSGAPIPAKILSQHVSAKAMAAAPARC